jgi:RNA polymerase sigma-70 factor (ECF subfamily)
VSPSQPVAGAAGGRDAGGTLLAIYDEALPQVYGYLVQRCRSRTEAEDLTSETFLAAVDAANRDAVPHMSTAWLVGVARHKLADHWRRAAREERRLEAVSGLLPENDDPWDEAMDALVAQTVLAGLGPQHRAALTLRYVDALPVPEVAAILGRTVHATEALLVRARSAFRVAYGERGWHG